MPDNRNLEAMADWIAFPETAERRPCDACGHASEVAILARDRDAQVKLVFVCKPHLLDPGPLLDY